MVQTNMKQKVVSGMIWKLAEKICLLGIQFVLQIVLARLLLPEEYGLVGLLTIFITVSDVFIKYGFTAALIQRKDVDDTDCSSVFIVNLLISIGIYCVLYFVAPWVAVFYKNERLVSLMRILSLNVVFGSLGSVHNAILSRELDFKKSFFRNSFNILTQGIVGIGAALAGFGAWALVLSRISGTLVGSLVLWITVKWKPGLKFSGSRVRMLFQFGSKVLGTNLLETIFNNMHSLIIGRFYSSAELGFYQKGQQMPQAFMAAIDGSFSEVLYPTLSALQDDIAAVKNGLRRSLKTSIFIVLPMLLGVIATADALISVLLTDKWLPCVPFMQLQCVFVYSGRLCQECTH
jgi:O-antigen/teichoic acid export membrane protein